MAVVIPLPDTLTRRLINRVDHIECCRCQRVQEELALARLGIGGVESTAAHHYRLKEAMRATHAYAPRQPTQQSHRGPGSLPLLVKPPPSTDLFNVDILVEVESRATSVRIASVETLAADKAERTPLHVEDASTPSPAPAPLQQTAPAPGPGSTPPPGGTRPNPAGSGSAPEGAGLQDEVVELVDAIPLSPSASLRVERAQLTERTTSLRFARPFYPRRAKDNKRLGRIRARYNPCCGLCNV